MYAYDSTLEQAIQDYSGYSVQFNSMEYIAIECKLETYIAKQITVIHDKIEYLWAGTE